MKKVVSDLKTLSNKGCKIAAEENFEFGEFCLNEPDFLVSVFLSPFNGLFAPHLRKSNIQTYYSFGILGEK